MSIFKIFQKKKKDIPDVSEEEKVSHVGKFKLLGKLDHSVLMPFELTDGLCIFIVFFTGEATSLSVNDIKVYNVFKSDTKEFIGSFYGVIHTDKYFGAFVGGSDVVVCYLDSFVFEQTDMVYTPLSINNRYRLDFVFNYENCVAMPCCVQKTDINSEMKDVLYEFETSVSMNEALQVAIAVKNKYDELNKS